MQGSTIPFGVISTRQAEKLLGISVKQQKKEQTSDLTYTTFEYKGLLDSVDSRDNPVLMREAILDAITSPYLRGVIAFFFEKDKTTIYISQVQQNPILDFELQGVIVTCYEEMSRHLNQKFVVSFQERRETHMIEGSGFSQFMIDKSNECNFSEILLVNVHHDYIKAYSNIHDETILLDLLIEMNNKKA